MSEFWENDLDVILKDDFTAVDGTWNGENVRIIFDSTYRFTSLPADEDVQGEPLTVYVKKADVPSAKHGDAVVVYGKTYFAGVIDDDKSGLLAVALWKLRT